MSISYFSMHWLKNKNDNSWQLKIDECSSEGEMIKFIEEKCFNAWVELAIKDWWIFIWRWCIFIHRRKMFQNMTRVGK